MGGPDTIEATIAGRQSDRPAGVGPDGKVHRPAGHRGGRPAGRATRDAVRGLRILRRAVMGVFAGQAPGQFVGQGLAGEIRPGVQQALHGRGGMLRNVVGAKPIRVARSGGKARDVKQVLHCEAQPGQRAVGGSGNLGQTVGNEGVQRVVRHDAGVSLGFADGIPWDGGGVIGAGCGCLAGPGCRKGRAANPSAWPIADCQRSIPWVLAAPR